MSTKLTLWVFLFSIGLVTGAFAEEVKPGTYVFRLTAHSIQPSRVGGVEKLLYGEKGLRLDKPYTPAPGASGIGTTTNKGVGNFFQYHNTVAIENLKLFLSSHPKLPEMEAKLPSYAETDFSVLLNKVWKVGLKNADGSLTPCVLKCEFSRVADTKPTQYVLSNWFLWVGKVR